MRYEQLEYLTAVARLGSFRRAAEEMHISQPALSATIRNLELELGVDILERGRFGARVSRAGQELLPHVLRVIEATQDLRQTADDQHQFTRMVRVGAVSVGNVSLVTPAVEQFRREYPDTQVEVVGAQEDQIDLGLREGRFDLGLITCFEGDDMPADLESSLLLVGRPVVVMRTDSPLLAEPAVTTEQLASEGMILMRSGYLMHRFVHRVLQGHAPSVSYSTDDAEMGKLMVAEGLGVTVLPDFSVSGDPLERGGLITYRPLAAAGEIEVQMRIRRRRGGSHSEAARTLHRIFLQRAQSSAPAAGGKRLSPDNKTKLIDLVK